MRHIVYFSSKAVTTGNFKDLMKAGRMDIVLHVVIASFFLSHDFRKDVKLHLVFYGMPDPPKHIEIQVTPDLSIRVAQGKTGALLRIKERAPRNSGGPLSIRNYYPSSQV